MNNKFILSLFILLITGCKTNSGINDLKKMNLNGNVKYLKEVSYEIVEIKKGDTTKVRSVDTHRVNESNFICTFNLKGDLTTKQKLDLDNSPNKIFNYEYGKDGLLKKITENYGSGTLISEIVIFYDSDSKVMEKQHYNSVRKLIQTDEYTYDTDNKTLEVNSLSSNSGKVIETWIYAYDNNGNISSQEYHQYDKLWSIEEFKYNSDNLKIEYRLYDKGESLGAINFYEYDDNQNLIKKYNGKLDGTKELKTKYQYDKFNNIIKSASVNPLGKEEKTTWLYNYDYNNNWVSVKIDEDNWVLKSKMPTFVIERTIEYAE